MQDAADCCTACLGLPTQVVTYSKKMKMFGPHRGFMLASEKFVEGSSVIAQGRVFRSKRGLPASCSPTLSVSPYGIIPLALRTPQKRLSRTKQSHGKMA